MTKVFVDGSGCLKYQILKYFAHWIWNETEQIMPRGILMFLFPWVDHVHTDILKGLIYA